MLLVLTQSQVVLSQVPAKTRQRTRTGYILTPAVLMRESQTFLKRRRKNQSSRSIPPAPGPRILLGCPPGRWDQKIAPVPAIRRSCASWTHDQRWSLRIVCFFVVVRCPLLTRVLLSRYCRGVDNNSEADAKLESESGLRSRKQTLSPRPRSTPWYKFDDETVSKVQLKDVLDAEAYILM